MMTVPVIMGVLSNNSQNQPALTVGDNRITNKQAGSLAVSGYAEGQVSKDISTGEKPSPPDGDLKSEHPNSTPAAQQVPANVKLNKFGLRPDQPLSSVPGGLEAAQAAREKARSQGKSVQEVENAAMAAVANVVRNREAQATAPTAPFKTGAQRESPDVQNITAGDVKEQDLAEEKTVMPIPDDPVQSAMKAIQTIIENITQKMDKYLNAIQSYVDTVSNTTGNLEDMICKGAMQAAKYMKVLMDKIMEFVLKQLNSVMTKVVASMPSSFRNQMGDLKEKLNEMILGMYNQMIAGLGDQMCSALMDALRPAEREQQARDIAANQGSGGGGGQSGIDPDTEKPSVLEMLWTITENLRPLQKFQCVMLKV